MDRGNPMERKPGLVLLVCSVVFLAGSAGCESTRPDRARAEPTVEGFEAPDGLLEAVGAEGVSSPENPEPSESQPGSSPALFLPELPIKFEPQPRVPVLIVSSGSGLVMEIVEASPDNGAPVILAEKHERSHQLFFMERTEGDTFLIRAKHSGKTLNVTNGAIDDGAEIQQWEGDWDENRWNIASSDGQHFRIIGKRSNRCLEPVASISGSRIRQANCVEEGDPRAALQSWLLFPAKKGACWVTRSAGWEERVKRVQASWYYTWGNGLPATSPAGIEYVPMIWGYWSASEGFQKTMATLRDLGRAKVITHLLGFNEPDGAAQANMTVARAIEAWPWLQSTGLRLGSPAAVHADGPWMSDFMAQVEKSAFQVDYVTVHWYGAPNAESLVSKLKRVFELYKRSIWITEFAPADWNASATKPNRFTTAQVESFMRKVLPMLDALPFVERYAWFSFNRTSAVGGISALLDESGNLTPLGEIYRAHPLPAPSN